MRAPLLLLGPLVATAALATLGPRRADAQLAAPAPPPAAARAPHPSTAPRHAGRAVGGVVGGFVVGLAGGLATALLTAQLVDDNDDQNFRTIAAGGTVGYALGAAAIVTLAGDHPGGRGDFAASLGGAALGGLIAYATSRSGEPEVTIAAYFALPLAGAVAGYWLSHAHVTSEAPPVGALVQVRAGGVRLGLPAPVPLGAGHAGLALAAGTF